jgi:hypothetical protein
MSLFQCIRRLLRSNNYDVSTDSDPQINDEPFDEPPEYDDPPSYCDIKHDFNQEKETIPKSKSKTTIAIEKIISNIRNNKYNMGCLILDDNTPSPSKIIKYLVENYSTSNDIMLYMIKNKKHNHTINIGKERYRLNNQQNKIFFIGSINLNIQINKKVFNFSKYKCGVFSTIFISENGWQGNAIHHVGFFDGSASHKTIINIDNFIKLF